MAKKLGNYSWEFKRGDSGKAVVYVYYSDRETGKKTEIGKHKEVSSAEDAEEYILDCMADHRGLIRIQQGKAYDIGFNATCIEEDGKTIVSYAQYGINDENGFTGFIDHKVGDNQWAQHYYLDGKRIDKEEGGATRSKKECEAAIDEQYPGLMDRCWLNYYYYIDIEPDGSAIAKKSLKEISPTNAFPGSGNEGVTVFRSGNRIPASDEEIADKIQNTMEASQPEDAHEPLRRFKY